MGNTNPIEQAHREVMAYDIPLKEHPKTVLDIGANIGLFSLKALEFWPETQIIAYEPSQQAFEAFPYNSRISKRNCAIRGFNGQGDLLKGDCLTTSSFHNLGRQTLETTTVDCIDASELESAEFVKIDTEGCEVEILSRLDLSKTKAIALEYHSQADHALIVSFMDAHGFVPYQNYGGSKDNGVLRYVRSGVELDKRKQKLFIGLPVYFSIDPHFWKSSLKLMAEFSVNCRIQPLIGDSLIPRARNALSRMFLESDCTHLLMIDSDLVFSNEQIKRIISHDEDIVGGFYPKKKEGGIELVCNALDPQPPMDVERRLTSLKYIGSGFICISRHVFEKMIEVYGKDIEYTLDEHQDTKEYDFWSCGVYSFPDGTKRYLSEDWYFCQRALDLGFKVYGDNGVTLRHSGSAIYPLQYQLETQPIFSRNTTDSAAPSAEAVSPRFPIGAALTT